MSKSAGVWIDHQQAIVVWVADGGGEIKKIQAETDKPKRTAGTARPRLSRRDFVAEDHEDRRALEYQKKFYDEVHQAIGAVDALLIMGPGEAKVEFSKFCRSKRRKGITEQTEALGKLTERQLVAHVVEHFEEAPSPLVAQRQKKAAKRIVTVAKPASKTPKKPAARKKGRR